MIRNPLSVRFDPASSLRDQIRQAATLGAKGAVIEATGDLHPDRLGDSGRREVRHLLRSVELSSVALVLPTRSSFDHTDDLDARLRRADRAFALAYDLGMRMVLVRTGAVPPEGEADAARRAIYSDALGELARLADHRGIRLALETGTESGATLRAFLEAMGTPALGASVEPGALLAAGIDPVLATRELGPWVAHAYATNASQRARPTVIANPRGLGFPPGALDWEEYLGALEEVNYHGFLTAWPEPGRMADQLPTLIERLKRF
jgi:sugar phosphate isomerase/epimerase